MRIAFVSHAVTILEEQIMNTVYNVAYDKRQH